MLSRLLSVAALVAAASAQAVYSVTAVSNRTGDGKYEYVFNGKVAQSGYVVFGWGDASTLTFDLSSSDCDETLCATRHPFEITDNMGNVVAVTNETTTSITITMNLAQVPYHYRCTKASSESSKHWPMQGDISVTGKVETITVTSITNRTGDGKFEYVFNGVPVEFMSDFMLVAGTTYIFDLDSFDCDSEKGCYAKHPFEISTSMGTVLGNTKDYNATGGKIAITADWSSAPYYFRCTLASKDTSNHWPMQGYFKTYDVSSVHVSVTSVTNRTGDGKAEYVFDGEVMGQGSVFALSPGKTYAFDLHTYDCDSSKACADKHPFEILDNAGNLLGDTKNLTLTGGVITLYADASLSPYTYRCKFATKNTSSHWPMQGSLIVATSTASIDANIHTESWAVDLASFFGISTMPFASLTVTSAKNADTGKYEYNFDGQTFMQGGSIVMSAYEAVAFDLTEICDEKEVCATRHPFEISDKDGNIKYLSDETNQQVLFYADPYFAPYSFRCSKASKNSSSHWPMQGTIVILDAKATAVEVTSPAAYAAPGMVYDGKGAYTIGSSEILPWTNLIFAEGELVTFNLMNWGCSHSDACADRHPFQINDKDGNEIGLTKNISATGGQISLVMDSSLAPYSYLCSKATRNNSYHWYMQGQIHVSTSMLDEMYGLDEDEDEAGGTRSDGEDADFSAAPGSSPSVLGALVAVVAAAMLR